MKFICPICHKVFTRDTRQKISQKFLSKKGYLSFCSKYKKDVYAKEGK